MTGFLDRKLTDGLYQPRLPNATIVRQPRRPQRPCGRHENAIRGISVKGIRKAGQLRCNRRRDAVPPDKWRSNRLLEPFSQGNQDQCGQRYRALRLPRSRCPIPATATPQWPRPQCVSVPVTGCRDLEATRSGCGCRAGRSPAEALPVLRGNRGSDHITEDRDRAPEFRLWVSRFGPGRWTQLGHGLLTPARSPAPPRWRPCRSPPTRGRAGTCSGSSPRSGPWRTPGSP